jgi:hypothetical protein
MIIPINVDQRQIALVIRLLKENTRLSTFFSISEGLRIPSVYEDEDQGEYPIVKQYQFERWTPIRKGTRISKRNLKRVIGTSSKRFIKINNPKILLAEDALEITASIDAAKRVPQGGVYFGVVIKDHVNLKYVLGLLNSRLLSCLYEILFGGMHMGGGYLRYRTSFLESLPFPDASQAEQMLVADFTDRILAAKKKDSGTDVSMWERRIDDIVYKLYGLTQTEIQLVEKGL